MKKSKWTQFWDMHSGGKAKEKWAMIYIEAPEAEARVIFYNRFGHNPDRVTCTCCGSDYSISESPSLAQASGYHRGCAYAKNGSYIEKHDGKDYRPYLTVAQYSKQKGVLVIPAKKGNHMDMPDGNAAAERLHDREQAAREEDYAMRSEPIIADLTETIISGGKVMGCDGREWHRRDFVNDTRDDTVDNLIWERDVDDLRALQDKERKRITAMIQDWFRDDPTGEAIVERALEDV